MELAHRIWNSKSPEKTKMILLHGMGGTRELWRPIAASLQKNFTLMAVDQRGHGESQRVDYENFTPSAFGQDVIDTMKHTHFSPSWIIGHSMGVRTACAAAHLKPDWIKGLVLIDLGFSGPAGGGLGERLENYLKPLPMNFSSRSEAKEILFATAPDESLARYLFAVLQPRDPKDLQGPTSLPFNKEALIQTIHAAKESRIRDWVEELAKKGMKILALRGELSTVWSKEEYEHEKDYFSHLDTVRFQEIEGAGHGLPFEKRKEFTEKVTEFVS
jgi:esterase